MGWFALALLLSSLSLVWGLTRLWRRRIRQADRERPPEAAPITDPMQAALLAGRRAGVGALIFALPAEVVSEDVDWSIAFSADGPLELCALKGHDAAAVISFQRADGGAIREDLDGEFGGFGQHLALRGDGSVGRLWLYSDLPPTAFDLLSATSAAAHLSRSDLASSESTDPMEGGTSCETVPVVAWTSGGYLHGALPPFGKVEKNANAVRFLSVCRLGQPGAAPEAQTGANFSDHVLEVPLAGLRCARLPDGGVQLVSGEIQVSVRRLDGRSQALLSFFAPLLEESAAE